VHACGKRGKVARKPYTSPDDQPFENRIRIQQATSRRKSVRLASLCLPEVAMVCESIFAMTTSDFTADGDFRIAKIELDEQTILWRNADVEQERRVAVFDLIEENTFKPLRSVERGLTGPYHLMLAVIDGRLALKIADTQDQIAEELILGLGRFRRPIREYFAICDSYYQAIRKATPDEIETIDMARRGIHNSAAELLLERLEGKVDTDFATARRLFTLICVLHIKG
jgi:uncharacterized protein (UPF0262 family)